MTSNSIAKLAVIKSSVANVNALATDILHRAGRSKVIPAAYKKSLRELSLATIAALNHTHELEQELQHSIDIGSNSSAG